MDPQSGQFDRYTYFSAWHLLTLWFPVPQYADSSTTTYTLRIEVTNWTSINSFHSENAAPLTAARALLSLDLWPWALCKQCSQSPVWAKRAVPLWKIGVVHSSNCGAEH